MRARRAHPGYACDSCGYDLTPLVEPPGAPGEGVTCPECGTAFGWPPPIRRGRWPNPVRIAASASGANAAFLAVLWLLCLSPEARSLLLALWMPLAAIWAALAFAPPWWTARALAERHAAPHRWGAVRAAFTLAGWLANAGLTWLALSTAPTN